MLQVDEELRLSVVNVVCGTWYVVRGTRYVVRGTWYVVSKVVSGKVVSTWWWVRELHLHAPYLPTYLLRFGPTCMSHTAIDVSHASSSRVSESPLCHGAVPVG